MREVRATSLLNGIWLSSNGEFISGDDVLMKSQDATLALSPLNSNEWVLWLKDAGWQRQMADRLWWLKAERDGLVDSDGWTEKGLARLAEFDR